MTPTQDDKVVRTDLWHEGVWLDMWSTVHTISGVSFGLGLYFLHLSSTVALLLVLALLVVYELWEARVEIEETLTNRVMDVVVGLAGFLVAFFILAPALEPPVFIPVFVLVVIANIGLSIIGWRASQKAAALEARVRVRLIAQRKRLHGRQMWLKEKWRTRKLKKQKP